MEKQVKSHELFAHVKLYQKRPKHPWACATCKVVIDKSKHVQHRQSKHPELKDGWTHCKHCQLVFRCDAQLKDHLDENSRCNSQYSEEDLMKINTNVIQSKKEAAKTPEKSKPSNNTPEKSKPQSSNNTPTTTPPKVTFSIAPIVTEAQPFPDSSSTSSRKDPDCKVVAIKKSKKDSSQLRKRLEDYSRSRSSSPEIRVLSENLVDSRKYDVNLDEIDKSLPFLRQINMCL